MSKILALGDSFTWGEELEDRHDCWAQRVADHFNLKLDNHGIAGGSNQRAMRMLMMHTLKDVALVCIGWSHFDRFEVSDELGTWDIWPGGQRSKYVKEASWRKTLTDYVSRHHNDDNLYMHYLTYIVLVQSYLKQKQIPFIMMDAFGNNEDQRRTDSKFKVLLDQVNSDTFIGWPDSTMMDWAKDTPHGPGNHFLEQGHEIVANRVIKQVNKIYEL
mgnify:FL=1